MKKNIKFLMILGILFLLTNMLITAVSAFPYDGLVIYYPFNGNANDESGNGNNGIVNGATLATNRFGYPNSAYNFDGVDDYIENNTFQNIVTNITITAWIKYEPNLPDINTGTIITLEDYNENNVGFAIHLNGTENNMLEVRFIITDNNDRISSVHTSPITSNNWYFIAVSYDGINQSIFLNGSLLHSKENSEGINPVASSLLISRSENIHPWEPIYFHGLIDDIRVYERALSALEIQKIYCADLFGCQYGLYVCNKDLNKCNYDLGEIIYTINNGILGLQEIKQLLKTPPGKRYSSSDYEGELGDLLNRIIDTLVSPPGEAISK